ncbi:hypothetical protein ACP70R_031624 [Stipagrostis hirtigluma subsp. patula]
MRKDAPGSGGGIATVPALVLLCFDLKPFLAALTVLLAVAWQLRPYHSLLSSHSSPPSARIRPPSLPMRLLAVDTNKASAPPTPPRARLGKSGRGSIAEKQSLGGLACGRKVRKKNGESAHGDSGLVGPSNTSFKQGSTWPVVLTSRPSCFSGGPHPQQRRVISLGPWGIGLGYCYVGSLSSSSSSLPS